MNVDDSLNNVLDVLNDDTTTEVVHAELVEVVDSNKNSLDTISCKDDAKEDYALGRNTLHQLLSAGQEALEGALDVAKNTDSPRAYEVVATTFKNLADCAEKLLDLQKKANALDGITPGKNSAGNQRADVINNTFFTGTTEDLHALLDGKKRGEE